MKIRFSPGFSPFLLPDRLQQPGHDLRDRVKVRVADFDLLARYPANRVPEPLVDLRGGYVLGR